MDGIIVEAGAGTRLQVLNDSVTILLSSEQTKGALMVAQQRSAPGSGVPLHTNEREDEVFQVLEGELEFQLGEKVFIGGPGALIFAPRTVPHSFRVVGERPALIQIIATPGGLDRMIGEIVKLGTPPPAVELNDICKRYGVTFFPRKNDH